MNPKENCAFCRAGRDGLLNKLPSGTPCNRGIYEDDCCIATLAVEQYTKGHTLLILKTHRTDIADSSISPEEFSRFTNAIHKIAKHLKMRLGDNDDNAPERIYVSILCDGVEHLHAHLVPRYKFTSEDKISYTSRFEARHDGNDLKEKIEKNNLGGFWYLAEREESFKSSWFGKQLDEEKVKHLEELARDLRISMF